ncbi:MAG: T9SS type A sorting domain-containing protein [Candidatus Cloacimonetes bacterium]|nr:T9SS type A sorting domain-containing protein [Candidatus Cloacimonadota bacterium]
MKRLIFTLALIFLVLSLSAAWVEVENNVQLFNHNSLSRSQTSIQFELDGYDLETIIENEEVFSKISYENEGRFIEEGKPNLPRFTRLIAIPDVGEVSFNITSIDEQVIPNTKIYPSQPLSSKSNPYRGEFVIDEDFYNGSQSFPQSQVEIGEPVIMRDYRIVAVTVNAFQYDPHREELHVINNIEVEVSVNGNPGTNIKTTDRKKSRTFEPLYRSSLLNYDSFLSRDDEFQQPSYLFIYPNNAAVLSTLEYLTDWKREKGFNVVSASTAETGTSLNQIKSYIQDAYDNWENKPEFICLVGDASGSFNIPTGYVDSGEGDHYYTLLEGNDILADAFIGRLSFNSILELQTVVSKILHYEKEPYLDQTEWYEKALLVGDPTTSGTSCIDTNIFIKDMILQHNPDFDVTEVYSGPWISQMTSGINGGVSYFNYRGFAGMSGWDNSNTNSLNNGFMLPIAVSLSCNTGNFASETSYSEAFLRAGTPSVPKGAIAAISTATPNTHTCFNNIVDAGIFHGIFSKGIYNLGGALVNAKNDLYLNYPENPANKVTQFSYWNNLMGDPGLDLWTAIPEEIYVVAPSEINVGNNFTEIQVTDSNGDAITGSWITIVMNDIQTTAFSAENGFVLLPFEPEETGTATLTVTKHNFIPNISEIEIVENDVFINHSDFQIDDSAGNNDGYINSNETIAFGIELQNYGTTTANGVSAILSCESDDINITNNSADYGSINSGGSAYANDDFAFTVDGDVYGGQEIIFTLEIEDDNSNVWFDNLILNVSAPNMMVNNYEIQGNGIIDPGDMKNLTITLENIGQVSGNTVSGVLSCTDNRIEIIDGFANYGNINTGQSVENSADLFTISADLSLITGMQIPMLLTITDAAGYDEVQTFLLSIGEVSVENPLGPDEYGYYCYDDSDVGYVETPEYDWIDISNTGTNLNFNDNGNTGQTTTINLPIEFLFYGETYDQLSICSNGWVAPGDTDNTSFMNWNIPGPSGPSPIIAVFWDDLRTGDVYYRYDTTLDAFIIQWDNMINEYNNDPETFQVILYDVDSNPTYLGDSVIKMQYLEVNNVDVGSYSGFFVDHGLYATVGIENPDGTIGLGYTCNNQYPVAAKTLQNEMAIVFTGEHLTHQGAQLLFGGITINDDDNSGTADVGETIDLDVVLNNVGSLAAYDIHTQISSTDEYITIIQDESDYNRILAGSSGINLSDFSIEIAENCPDGHLAMITMNIETDLQNFEIHFNLPINSPVIDYSGLIINDGDNQYLDPAETTDLILNFFNSGGDELENATISISENDEYIVLNTFEYYTGNCPSEYNFSAVFSISATVNAPVGHIAEFSYTISGDNYSNETGVFQLVISQEMQLLVEDFSDYNSLGWTQEQTGGNDDPWEISNTSEAGGSSPEIKLDGSSFSGNTAHLISPVINTAGANELYLSFIYLLYNYASDITLQLMTRSNFGNWHIVDDLPVNNLAYPVPVVIDMTIDNEDVGSNEFQFAFYYIEGGWTSIHNWNIDNILLTGDQLPSYGFLSGTVELLNGTGELSDVQIVSSTFAGTPNETGEYFLPLPVGTHTVEFLLEGYETISNTFEINAGETVTFDTTLNYFEPPENLALTVSGNNFSLNWDSPNTDVLNYKIFRSYNAGDFIEIQTTENTYYSEINSPSGNYKYYVTAVYESGTSAPSEIVENDLLDSDNVLIPLHTSLHHNYPNPFNPTTTISYSLKENSKISLNIYNIKGQLVKKLVDEQMNASVHNVVWNGKNDSGRNVSSGVYFHKMRSGHYTSTRKMILLK